MFRYSFIFVGLVLACLQADAQTLSNLHQKKVRVGQHPILIDSNILVPNSVLVPALDTSFYWVDYNRGLLFFKHLPTLDTVWVWYRVIPTKQNTWYYRYRYDSVADHFRAVSFQNKGRVGASSQESLIDFGGLTYSGSFARNLSFGNAQDAVLNSQFNLQVSGLIGDSIEVSAAITDNNIPIQPDGSTQQLNEFDNIWIQFKKRKWQINLGDIDVRRDKNYFLNFYKRQQGIAFENTVPLNGKMAMTNFFSAAIAKGKFTRNIFNGVEGNQGPYRLQGANNELFFVVMAGTERVFVDGQLLERGEDKDYIINYNSAEIKFTPRLLISKDKRIQVEFEYADRNYLNALVYASTSLRATDRFQIYFDFYNNTDAKNAPINQVLGPEQRTYLANVGNQVQSLLYQSAAEAEYDAARVQYIRKDTVVGGVTYNIFVQAVKRASEVYNVSFSNLGNGLGNYNASLNAANEMVYQWVPPVDGVPQGSFEPVVRLAAPKRQQMIAAGLHLKPGISSRIKLELAASNFDPNTFSKLGNSQNKGVAGRFQFEDERLLRMLGNSKVKMQYQVSQEYVSENFRPLERLRSVEFYRDWGLPLQSHNLGEQVSQIAAELADSSRHRIQTSWMRYHRSDGYTGIRYVVGYSMNLGGISVSTKNQFTFFRAKEFEGRFLRPNFSISKNFKQVELGARYQLEWNEVFQQPSDTLSNMSFAFRDWGAFAKGKWKARNTWMLEWTQRKNQFAAKQGFVPLDINDQWNLRLDLLNKKFQQIQWWAGFRKLNVVTAGLTTQQSDRTLLSRAEYAGIFKNGLFTLRLLYELGAGQEQQRSITYIEVPAGRGEYTWIDYDQDGILQLNEFELAQFSDQANYVRIFTPTNIYLKTNYHVFNYALLFTPPEQWHKKGQGFKNVAAKFNAQTAWQLQNNALSDQKIHWLPNLNHPRDSLSISYSSNFTNTLSFNRTHPKWGMDINYNRNTLKSILVYGFETRIFQERLTRFRWTLTKQYIINAVIKQAVQELVTPNQKFVNRNYLINIQSLEANLQYTRNSMFRFKTKYLMEQKKGNSTTEHIKASNHTVSIESKYNSLQKGMVTSRLTFTKFTYPGVQNSTLSYIMLQGLEPGKNWLWNVEFTRRVFKNFEITIAYDGRKPGDIRTIHQGRAGIRAIL